MGKWMIVALTLSVLVLAPVSDAMAGRCASGCSKPRGVCSKGVKYDTKGCATECNDIFTEAKPACSVLPEGCVVEEMDRILCLTVCSDSVDPLVAMCDGDRNSCVASCDAKPGTCADACGSDPVTSLKTCASAALGDLKTCKNSCGNNNGGCLRGCASTAWAALDACRVTFDTCMGLC